MKHCRHNDRHLYGTLHFRVFTCSHLPSVKSPWHTNALCVLFFNKRKLEEQRRTVKPSQMNSDQPEQCYPSNVCCIFALNPKCIKMPPWKSCYKMAFPCSVTLCCPLEIFGLHTQLTPIFPHCRCFSFSKRCSWEVYLYRGGERVKKTG